MEKNLLPDIPNLHLLDVYLKNGGFEAAKKAFQKSTDEIIDEEEGLVSSPV